ncbi:MAG: hypothetical protein AUJ49_07530 [Desulfovibrionaceae bacterium CG1_02_65_16]|nr:MAG: hypothetical protein AUJ49_07530 [Desulfovibrionaceae bacterium CG1_02_65_16]
MSRNFVLTAILFALTYAAGFYFRIYVVDTPVSGAAGDAVLDALRQGVLFAQLHSIWGWLSLVAGVLALLLPGRAVVHVWSVLTAAALVNYNGDLGAVGFALGVLRLARF